MVKLIAVEERRPDRPAPVKGFLGILSGSAVAQLLAVGAIPLLARMYGPAATSRYALLLSISTVIASFASFRLDLAIPLPMELEDSRQLFWMAALIPLVVAPFAGLALVGSSLAGIYRPPGLVLVDVSWIVLFVVVLCAFSATSQLGIRVRAYGVLGRVPVLQMLATLVAQTSLGAIGLANGLFVGSVAGRSLGLTGIYRACGLSRNQRPTPAQAQRLIRKYWRFPVILAPAGVINVLGANIDFLMLPALFGQGPGGLYVMAFRVSGVPATIVGESAGRVFLAEFARETSRTKSVAAFFKWSAVLFLMALIVSTGFWFCAPFVLPRVLGDDWAGTAQLAQYTGIMAGAAIFGAPVQNVWTVRQRASTQLAWNVFRLVGIAGTIWVSARAHRPLAAVVANMTVAAVVVYALAWAGSLWAAIRPSAGTL